MSLTWSGTSLCFCSVESVQSIALFLQVLPHVRAGGPGVPAGAVRAERRVLAHGVLARAHPEPGPARRPPAAQSSR